MLAVAGCGSVTAADAGAASTAGPPPREPPGRQRRGQPQRRRQHGAQPRAGQRDGRPDWARVSGLLCAAPGAVSQVIITRTGFGRPVLPSQPPDLGLRDVGQPSDAGLLVTGRRQARALAKAVCGLPAMTGAVLHCPKLGAPGFRLTFTAGGRMLPVVIVQPSGCLTVTGAGPVRTAARSSAFLKLLTSMAGPPAARRRAPARRRGQRRPAPPAAAALSSAALAA